MPHQEQWKCSDCVFLDLSKAFDCIEHNILLDKLYWYGTHGIPHMLNQSYLANRTQIVQISHKVDNHWKDYFSSCLPVKFRVSPGSVLGPLLFIIYVNDIPKVNSDMTIMYADDTSVINVGSNLEELGKAMSVNIERVTHNFEVNNLCTNLLKSNFLLFQTRQSKLVSNLKVVINNKEIRKEKSTNFLPVIIDSNLTWELHI
jgi:hypothetical protein